MIRSTDTIPFDGFLIWAHEDGQVCSAGSWTPGTNQRERMCSFFGATDVCFDSPPNNALTQSTRLNTFEARGTFNVPVDQSGSLIFK